MKLLGSERPVTLYELCSESCDEGAIGRYQEALEAYFERRFDDVIQVLDTQPEDGPSENLLGRARRYQESPPPEDWNGVWQMLSK